MFIFDRQEGRRAEAMERLHEIVFKWAKVDPRFKDIRLVNHEITVCVDPADYLAFAIRENIVNRQGKKAKATKPILAGYKEWRRGIFTRKQVNNMTKRAHCCRDGAGRRSNPNYARFCCDIEGSGMDRDEGRATDSTLEILK